ncbi:unnamed protein product [Rhizopus stolonifer]
MDSLQVHDSSSSKRRLHSNTVTGARPPALDISLARPTNVRRNSEGSPRVPPIEIMEPTPIEPSEGHQLEGFHEEEISPAPVDCSQVYNPNSVFKAEPKTAINNSSAMSH